LADIKQFIDVIDTDLDETLSEGKSGIVIFKDGEFQVGYESLWAEEHTFSVGQPIYDSDNNIMGYLGIGLYAFLYHNKNNLEIPCMYWKIYHPTKYCEAGKQIYTYWQMLKRTKKATGGT